MVRRNDIDTSTGSSGARGADRKNAARFVVTGESSFIPLWFPEVVRVRKQRNLNRQKGFCGGEDVSDNGSSNRDIHVSGRLVSEAEKDAADSLGDVDVPVTLSSSTWSGEVRVKEIEIEGPTGWSPTYGLIWDYTMDFVSTGRDEPGTLIDEIGGGLNSLRQQFEGEDERRGL